ncbi:MAG: leucine-rich repeat domain-containing protein [Verrucomicrobia bacterium]|nr:leucine-rich repeat domain-containing protein [Verrucomicrobiota bacterium]
MAIQADPAQRRENFVLSDSISLYSGSPRKVRYIINEYLDIGDLISLMGVSRSHLYATVGSAFQNSVWVVQQRKWGYRLEVTDVPLAHRVILEIFKKAEEFSSRFKFIRQIIKSPKVLAANAQGHCHHRVALKALRALLSWFPHRDTLVVWEKVAEMARLKKFDEPTSIQDTAQKASQFAEWISEHQSAVDQKIKLNLAGLSVSFLHPAIGRLTQLQILCLQDNQLCRVPAAIGQLSSLKKLELQNNRLTSLSEIICHLYSLQALNVEDNLLTDIPPAIRNLTALEDLSLQGNQFSIVPAAIGQLSSLKTLLLRKNRLASLPEVICHLYSLQALNVEDNLLTDIPPAIRNLTSLTVLYLSENRLTMFPHCLGTLPRLQQLYLYSNQLTSVSLTDGQFTALQRLDVSENQLTSFRACQVSSLQTLELQANKLTSLDDSIHRLVGLDTLNVRGNQLDTLPEAIFQLTRLKSVNLRANRIVEYSDLIKRLKERGVKIYL